MSREIQEVVLPSFITTLTFSGDESTRVVVIAVSKGEYVYLALSDIGTRILMISYVPFGAPRLVSAPHLRAALCWLSTYGSTEEAAEFADEPSDAAHSAWLDRCLSEAKITPSDMETLKARLDRNENHDPPYE